MGVLTHLDFFKENKQLRKTKKSLKKRFMYETGQDYKLFYLSGIKYDMYPQMEVFRLNFNLIIHFKNFLDPKPRSIHFNHKIQTNRLENKPSFHSSRSLRPPNRRKALRRSKLFSFLFRLHQRLVPQKQ